MRKNRDLLAKYGDQREIRQRARVLFEYLDRGREPLEIICNWPVIPKLSKAGFAAIIFGVLVFDLPALADDLNSTMQTEAVKSDQTVKHEKRPKAKRTTHLDFKHSAPSTPRAVVKTAAVKFTVAETSPAQFDKYGVKGWNIPFPSASDSLLQDYGGIRSSLASMGFGFLAFSSNSFNLNTLNTPTKVPQYSTVGATGARSFFPACSTSSGPVCAGGETYFGQRPSYFSSTFAFLTYDTSRWGIPDGQIVIGGNHISGNDDNYIAPATTLAQLSWYQTLFDKRVELKVGYTTNVFDFVGSYVGGNFANTFGVAASIPGELGLAYPPAPAPTARATVHLVGNVYDEFAIQRSVSVNGPTGNGPLDETRANPTGFEFTRPGLGVLYINELGYKNAAAPGVPQNWLRFGVMYNTSFFKDLSRLSDDTATVKGNSAFYFLADRQLWQQSPGSPKTAYRGIYAGASVMGAQPDATAFSQYYEGRLYWMGPFDSRPSDMASFVYSHNQTSHYLADQVNATAAPLAAQGFAVPLAYYTTNSYTVSYMAHIMPGIYGAAGFGYTDHPSLFYFSHQGSSLVFFTNLTAVF